MPTSYPMSLGDMGHPFRSYPKTWATRLRLADQPPRHTLLQRLDGIGKDPLLRLGKQQVNMLRHNDITIDTKLTTAPYSFEGHLEGLLTIVCKEESTPPIAAEGDGVGLSRLVKALQAPRHTSA